jgi:hypothetical protein
MSPQRRTLDVLQLGEGFGGRDDEGAQHAVVLADQHQVLDEGRHRARVLDGRRLYILAAAQHYRVLPGQHSQLWRNDNLTSIGLTKNSPQSCDILSIMTSFISGKRESLKCRMVLGCEDATTYLCAPGERDVPCHVAAGNARCHSAHHPQARHQGDLNTFKCQSPCGMQGNSRK